MEMTKWVRPHQSRAARALLNVSAKEFSDLSGVSPSTIDRYEAADGMPSVSLEKAISIRQGFEACGIAFIDEGEQFGVLASPASAGLARKALEERAVVRRAEGRAGAGMIAGLMMLAATGWGFAALPRTGWDSGSVAGLGTPQVVALTGAGQPSSAPLPSAAPLAAPNPSALPSPLPPPAQVTTDAQPICPPGSFSEFYCRIPVEPPPSSADRVNALKAEIMMAELEAAITNRGGSSGAGALAKPVAEMTPSERHDRINQLKELFEITELEAALAKNGAQVVADPSGPATEMMPLQRRARILRLKEDLDVARLQKRLEELRQASNTVPKKAEVPGQAPTDVVRYTTPGSRMANEMHTPIAFSEAPPKPATPRAKSANRLPQKFQVSLVETDGNERVLFEAHDVAKANRTLPVRRVTKIPYVTSVSVDLQTGKETRKSATLDAGVSATVIVKPLDDGHLEVQFAFDHTTLLRWNDLTAGDITLRSPVKNTLSHMTKVIVLPGEPIVYRSLHNDGERTEERVVVLKVDPAG